MENDEFETLCDLGAETDPTVNTRELVLVVLEQLYVCYEKLGNLDDAEPLLDRLVAVACGDGRANTH